MLKRNSGGNWFMGMFSDHHERGCSFPSFWDLESKFWLWVLSPWVSLGSIGNFYVNFCKVGANFSFLTLPSQLLRVWDFYPQLIEVPSWPVPSFSMSALVPLPDSSLPGFTRVLVERNGSQMWFWLQWSALGEDTTIIKEVTITIILRRFYIIHVFPAWSLLSFLLWIWSFGQTRVLLPFHSRHSSLSWHFGLGSPCLWLLLEPILDSGNESLSIPCVRIKSQDKYRSRVCTRRQLPGSSWAEFFHSVASSSNSFSSSIQFGKF